MYLSVAQILTRVYDLVMCSSYNTHRAPIAHQLSRHWHVKVPENKGTPKQKSRPTTTDFLATGRTKDLIQSGAPRNTFSASGTTSSKHASNITALGCGSCNEINQIIGAKKRERCACLHSSIRRTEAANRPRVEHCVGGRKAQLLTCKLDHDVGGARNARRPGRACAACKAYSECLEINKYKRYCLPGELNDKMDMFCTDPRIMRTTSAVPVS